MMHAAHSLLVDRLRYRERKVVGMVVARDPTSTVSFFVLEKESNAKECDAKAKGRL